MNIESAYGLLAHGLIFGGLASLLPLGILRPKAALVGTTIALIAGIAPVMHALIGPPSITLLILALLHLPSRPLAPLGYRGALALLVFAACFYPASAGLFTFDPYAIGYQPWPLLIALAPLCLALFLRGQAIWLLILAAGLTAYASGLFANLWDALIDPLLVCLAAAIVLRQWTLKLIAARRR